MKRSFHPNYFVGLRLPVTESPSFAAALIDITSEITRRNCHIERMFIGHGKIHLTLALVEIDETSTDSIYAAIACFQSSSTLLNQSFLASQNTLSFSGINAFGKPNRRNVLWLEPDHSCPEKDSILRYAQHVSSLFVSSGMQSEASDILHGTIAKKSRKNKNIVIKESDYLGLDHYFATPLSLPICEIDLLKIGSTDPETGYYRSVSKLRIGSPLLALSRSESLYSNQAEAVVKDSSDL